MEGFLVGAKQFFQQAKAAKQQKLKRVLFVVGNEAGDLDSLVSSISLAYILPDVLAAEKVECAIPVAPMPRNEFRLRGDAVKVFADAGCKLDSKGAPENLIFMDELKGDEWFQQVNKDDCGLVLTDHNSPNMALKTLFPMPIFGIVDHHSDAKLFQDAKIRYVDEGCGSCCSLVAAITLGMNPSVTSSNNNLGPLPQSLVEMVFSTILLDCRNFSEKQKRFNKVDVEVYEKLLDKYEFLPKEKDAQEKLYNELVECRHDVSKFSFADTLRLDFKSANIGDGKLKGKFVGIASIFDTMQTMTEKAGSYDKMEADMVSMMQQHNLHILILFSTSQKLPQVGKRKVLVFLGPKDDTSELISSLKVVPDNLPESLKNENPLFETMGINDEGFDLVPFEGIPGENNLHVYHIRKEPTRKVLMPTVLALLNKL